MRRSDWQPTVSGVGVEIDRDAITISDMRGEIVHWIEDEWRADPETVYSIAHAIVIALTDGPQRLRAIVRRA